MTSVLPVHLVPQTKNPTDVGLDGKVLIRKFLVKKINIPKKVGKKIHYIIILSPKFLKKYIINKTAPTIKIR